jgi:hypothetical protein
MVGSKSLLVKQAKAIENARKLKETHTQGEEHAKLVAMILTATFNLAYWHENNNDVARASDMYKQILREEPTYLDRDRSPQSAKKNISEAFESTFKQAINLQL